MFSSILALPFIAGAVVSAQTTPAVVCVAGQCLQGFTNTTIGTTLSAPGAQTSVLLLPGQYTSTTNPQLLHQLLTTPGAKLSPSPGYQNSSSVLTLPLNVALDAGMAVFPQSLYSGTTSFVALPPPSANTTNAPAPFSAGSIALATNIWLTVSSGNNRVVLWDSVPDMAQLPSLTSAGSLNLIDMQSASCSPACSGSGVCSALGVCTCPPGFNGTSCELCAPGFFGPSCQPCPANCATCDEGIAGSGACLKPKVTGAPESCGCFNGQCASGGQCSCNPGWTSPSNGPACSQCAAGFFKTTAGDCKRCDVTCVGCEDSTGACKACPAGFTHNTADPTKCDRPQEVTSAQVLCTTGFSDGNNCQPCPKTCGTCVGPVGKCITCAPGTFDLNGVCVGAAQNTGVCTGSPPDAPLIANSARALCDACPVKCAACLSPGFTGANNGDAQCTKCLPGSVLSNGRCLDSCPSGTFLSQDGSTCAPCDTSSGCSTCGGSAAFCLTCTGGQLASAGKCVATCPSTSFTTAGSNTCTACHSDCATCTGGAFNQCATCRPDRPVLSSGRCLPTCLKTQFFDKASSSCQSCDSSCGSCSSAGPTNCLSCSSSTQVVKGGSCVDANCAGSSSVITGLGVCLSTLVNVPSGTGNSPPLPSITGLNTPIARRPLEWWQILLMALGCAFIFLVILMLWRRRARKQRAKATAQFASAKALDKPMGWRYRLVRFGERLFGHRASRARGAAGTGVGLGAEPSMVNEEFKLMQLRDQEEERHQKEMEKILGGYEYSRAGTSHYGRDQQSAFTEPSIYSQVTGNTRTLPEPRMPMPKSTILTSRFSTSSFGHSIFTEPREAHRVSPPLPLPSDAVNYADLVRDTDSTVAPSIQSNNPFLKK